MRGTTIASYALAAAIGFGGLAAPFQSGAQSGAQAGEVAPEVKTVALTTAEGGVEQGALQSIDRVGRDSVAVLSNRTLTKAQRITYFRNILARNLDIPVLAKFMLGRHWKRATPEQRAAYIEVFSDFLLQTYATRLGGAKVDSFEVWKTETAKGTKDIFVHSRIRRSGAPTVRAIWRVRPYGEEEFRVVDLVVEGISMAITLRQEFASILRRDGVDGLIAMLRGRLT